MGIYSDISGYLFVGASPNELEEVKQCMAFNKEVVESLDPDNFWAPQNFRFSIECDHVRAMQAISIYKYHNNRIDLKEFQEIMVDAFSKLMWSDGFIVDRSIDRTLTRSPLAYEYALMNRAFSLREIEPVGDNLELEITIRQ